MSLVSFKYLFGELKRRRVFRVAGLYAVAAWVVVQVASTVFPILDLPGWAVRLVLILVLFGFPPALALAWAFDLDVRPDQAPTLAEAESQGARGARFRIARPAMAALVSILAATGAWAAWARSAGSSGAPAADAVAVFPFDVHAGAEDAYLRDGMVSLLSARLDGLGGLRSADPQALLRAMPGPPAMVVAARVATHFGAGLYVLGTVVGGAGRIEITASLYRSDGTIEPVATASAEGAADHVFDVVDRVAMELFSARARGSESDAVRTAALTTGSLAAFKAYLEGERALRVLRLGPAIDAFTRAVAIDTAFALAYSRLALAAWWDSQRASADSAAEEGERHSGRLPPHYREILAANRAFLRGAPDTEARYRNILVRYPHDAEVWYMLGEQLYHHAAYVGRSASTARKPFEEALRVDPGNEMYLVHLRELACSEDRARDLAQLNPNHTQEPLNPLLNGMMAALSDTTPERDRALQTLESANEDNFYFTLQFASICAPPAIVSRLYQAADRRSATNPWWEFTLDLTRGRWIAAKAVVAPPRPPDPVDQVFGRGRALLHALMSPSTDEIRRTSADLRSLDVANAPPSQLENSVYVTEMYRLYLIGRLAARAGHWDEERRMEEALKRPPQGLPDALRWSAFLSARLRAFALAAQGRREEALHALEEIDTQGVIGELAPHPINASVAGDNWLRAELLRELGRDQEALGWYMTLAENWGSPEFVAPANLRIAQLLERVGKKREAVRHYRRFVALWHDADPALQPLVRDAAAQMRTLEH